jgi:hypothetical protein
MPATASGARMPHNNRVHTSSTLNTSAIWQKSIGHDPYANAQEGDAGDDGGGDSKYAEFKSLLKIVASGKQDGAKRGVWKGRRPLRGVFFEPQYGYTGESDDEFGNAPCVVAVQSSGSCL